MPFAGSGRPDSAGVWGIVLFVGLLLQPAPGFARQVLHGRVIEAESSLPLAGAVVRLVGSDGSSLTTALTGRDGAFRMTAVAGVAFRVRVEMIGHRAWAGESMMMLVTDTAFLEVRLPVLAIQLDEIRSEVGNLCRRAADLPPVTDALWREVRTALAAERASLETGSLRFEVETYEREVATDSPIVTRDQRRRTATRNPEAFRSVSMAQLDEDGFFAERANGDFLFGPSTHVFLADWFTDTHCLGLAGLSADRQLLGIRFEPNAERRKPEIRGTLWMDAATRELRRADFTFVGLPARIPAGSHGAVVFQRLRDGVVVVSHWVIYSPIIELSEVRAFGERRPVERVVAMRETGGEVLRALRGTDTLYRAVRGLIRGLVFDSVNQVPLRDARVALAGTGFAARSDSLGRYVIEDLPDGTYRVVFDHPRLDAFGYGPAPVTVHVRSGSVHDTDLAIPRRAKLLVSSEDLARLDTIAAVQRFLGLHAEVKGPGARESERALFQRDRPARVVGRIMEHESGQPVSGVDIRLLPADTTIPSHLLTARTDANGHFEMPAVPRGDYQVIVVKPLFEEPTENRVTVEQGLEYRWVIRLRRLRPPREHVSSARLFRFHLPAPEV